MKNYLVSAIAGAVGILAFTATNASAAIVCNGEGDCWHVKDRLQTRMGHPGLSRHVDLVR